MITIIIYTSWPKNCTIVKNGSAFRQIKPLCTNPHIPFPDQYSKWLDFCIQSYRLKIYYIGGKFVMCAQNWTFPKVTELWKTTSAKSNNDRLWLYIAQISQRFTKVINLHACNFFNWNDTCSGPANYCILSIESDTILNENNSLSFPDNPWISFDTTDFA